MQRMQVTLPTARSSSSPTAPRAPTRRRDRPRPGQGRARGQAGRPGPRPRRPLLPEAPLEIVTERSGQDALDLIRHDAAHVFAAAMLELYPGVKISIGPPIEQGFYYDVDLPDGQALSDADFPRIEEQMRKHIKADEPFVREEVSAAEALERYRPRARTTRSSSSRTSSATRATDTVTLYTNGPFTDLCRGPHAPSTKRIKAFKLQSVAGAYWRGDASLPPDIVDTDHHREPVRAKVKDIALPACLQVADRLAA
jgi:threonyl-tRNA synthetase